MQNDLDATRELLSRQLTEAIATDPIRALAIITSLQRDADEHLRQAVRQAAQSSSWREIADGLGVSKQAAHQRFRIYAKGVADELRVHQHAMKRRRGGDADLAAKERAQRDEPLAKLKAAARALRDQV